MAVNPKQDALLTGKHLCTADDPWTPDKQSGAIHPDAKSLQDEGDYEQFECPNCGKVFWVEYGS